MNYALALKLKNAGFPQRKGCSACLQGYAFDFKAVPYSEAFGDDYVSLPTLSELMEACSNDEKQIYFYRLEYDNFERLWEAHAGRDFSNPYDGYGKTPEEAVANLWLEINKK